MSESLVGVFFTYFLVFIVCISVLFFVGELALRLLRIESFLSYSTLVRNVFVGYVLLITLYAIIRTHFITINIVYIFLLCCCIREINLRRNWINRLLRRDGRRVDFRVALIVIFLIFCWSWFSIVNPDSFVNFNYYGDNIFYSKVSRAIAETGFENVYNVLNSFDTYYNSPKPYHYFDLWGGGLIAGVFGLNHYLALQLVVYPIFFFLISANVLALSHRRGILVSIITCLLLFAGGLFLAQYEQIPFLGALRNFGFNALSPWMNKLSYFYVFAFSAYHLYVNNLKSISLLCLLGLTVAHILTFPVIVVSLAILVGYQYYARPSVRRSVLINAIYLLVTTVLIVSFYAIFERKTTSSDVELSSPIRSFLVSISDADWITRRNILIGGLLHLLIYFLPVLPVFLLFSRIRGQDGLSRFFPFAKWILCMVFVGLFGWSLMYRDINAYQIFVNVTVPFINCAVVIAVISVLNHFEYLWNRHSLLVLISLGMFSGTLLSQIQHSLPDQKIVKANQYSSEYLQRIDSVISSRSLRLGASIKDKSMLYEAHNKYNAIYPLGDYLSLIDESVGVVNIGDFNTPIDSSSAMGYERTRRAMNDAVFYRYAKEKLGGISSSPSIASLQEEFIERHQLQFLIVSRDVRLSENLLARVDEVIIDESTGEKFFVLEK